jgi:hypothetical protein
LTIQIVKIRSDKGEIEFGVHQILGEKEGIMQKTKRRRKG